MTLVERYLSLKEKVAVVCEKTGRPANSVKIIIATKYFNLSQIKELYDLGHRDFGENRLQDAITKMQHFQDCNWEFIGHLQSNKVKDAVQHFQAIQSVDSLKLLEKINAMGMQQNKKVRVLLQVHLSKAETQFGFLEDELLEVFPKMTALPHVEIRGLMTIAPLDSALVRPAFQKLRELLQFINKNFNPPHFKILSMGMSQDFEVAIEEGSTCIRIGRYLL